MASRISSTRTLLIVAATCLLAAAAMLLVIRGDRGQQVVAEFSRSTGLYTGSDVRILGVDVGTVTRVETRGDRVRVTMRLDRRHKIPADAKAAIVAPSLVSGRYIQIAPVYTGGAVLSDDAVIGMDRTAVPVEWDDIKEQLTRVTTALGPQDDSKDSPIADVLDAAATTFDGNGKRLRSTLASMSKAADSLSGNRDNLFLTVRSLADFLEAMNDSSRQIETFTTSLSDVSTVLSQNRQQLSLAMKSMDKAMGSLTSFIDDNHTELASTISDIRAVAAHLGDRQVQLANILHLAPTTLANFYNIYDPTAGTMTGRLAAGQTNGMSNFICQSVFSLGGTLDDCQTALSPLVDLFNMDPLPITVNPFNQPGTNIGGGQ